VRSYAHPAGGYRSRRRCGRRRCAGRRRRGDRRRDATQWHGVSRFATYGHPSIAAAARPSDRDTNLAAAVAANPSSIPPQTSHAPFSCGEVLLTIRQQTVSFADESRSSTFVHRSSALSSDHFGPGTNLARDRHAPPQLGGAFPPLPGETPSAPLRPGQPKSPRRSRRRRPARR
jgi:hypothetical protein